MPSRLDPDAGTEHLYRHGCALCGRADRLIDADVFIDYDGHIAFCEGCVADLATAAGFALTEAYAERLKAAELRASRAEALAEEATRTISALSTSADRIVKRHAQERAKVQEVPSA